MSGLIIAIDGPSGAGKSTVAATVAERLGLAHVDTGALYRAATLAVVRAGVDADDESAVESVVRDADIERRDGRTHLDGDDVEAAIRTEEVTDVVSTVASHRRVRTAMLAVQREAVAERGGVVEGRDIGTVVFPDADVKVFLTADPRVRAARRARQQGTDSGAVARKLARRDARDSQRAVAPLAAADDAVRIETSELDVEEVVQRVLDLVDADRGQAVPEGRETPDVAAVVAARQSLPRVAVLGRPNVGKSTLVNRVIGRRAAIVEERPGVTRDRSEYLVTWRDRPFLLVDTGGWEHAPDGLNARVVAQAERAVRTADAVVAVVDATVGALADDQDYADLLRRMRTPVVLAANKVDSPRQRPDIHELYVLGLGEPFPVSALHGRGVGDLLDAVVAALPPPSAPDGTPGRSVRTDPETAPSEAATTEEAGLPDESGVARVAVVGRPNVGKSSLFNRLVDDDRSIVDPVPHTTRDSVDTYVSIDGQPWVFVDTAGLRRRYRHGEDTELYSVDRMRWAVDAADLVLFVTDASESLAKQDQRLAALVRDAGCGVVLVLNKWDLVDDKRRRDVERELDRLLFFTSWAPRVNVSALTGRGIGRIVPWLDRVWDAYRTRIPTAELNRWLQDVTGRGPLPRDDRGRRVRVKYITQVDVRPPTFVVSASGRLPDDYRRYLQRQLRDHYEFVGAPLVIRG